MLMEAKNDRVVAKEAGKTASAPMHRLPIWEVNHCFKCPVIGMCITLDEQKRLLKKMGLLGKKGGPFEMHEIMVTAMDNENRLSRRIDNLLERKFGKPATALLELDEAALLANFKGAMEAGEAATVLWATAVSPNLSTTCRRTIFGDIHMTMHWNGEQLMRLKRKISRQQLDLGRLQERLDESGRHQRALKKEFNACRREKKTLQTTLCAEQREKQKLLAAAAERPCSNCTDDLKQQNQELQRVIGSLRRKLAQAEREIASQKDNNRKLSSRLLQQCEMSRLFREEARAIVAEMTSLNRCDANCPSFDLCRKRILIVGGVTRMEALYRDLIESSNGVFEYHDGYVKKGTKSLETSLKRADMVLCPVNCNSHAACSMVKNLGKKHNKTVHILANSSLSTVSQVIRGWYGRRYVHA